MGIKDKALKFYPVLQKTVYPRLRLDAATIILWQARLLKVGCITNFRAQVR